MTLFNFKFSPDLIAIIIHFSQICREEAAGNEHQGPKEELDR